MPVTIKLAPQVFVISDREACLVLRPLIDAYLGGPGNGRRRYTKVLGDFAERCATQKRHENPADLDVKNLRDFAGANGLNARNKMVSQQPPQVLFSDDFGSARVHVIEYAIHVAIPQKLVAGNADFDYKALIVKSLRSIGWNPPSDQIADIAPAETTATEASNGWRAKRTIIYTNRHALQRLAGRYLVLRRTFSDRPNHLIVSFMELFGPTRDGDPGFFRTQGRLSVRGKDNTYVEGIYYVFGGSSFDDMHVAFEGAVGEPDAPEWQNPQPRHSILKQTENPANPNAERKDLCGIRQGIGRVKFRPRGYRIYCARIESAEVVKDWRSLIGEYELRHHADPLHGHAATIAWREAQRKKDPDLVKRIEQIWPRLKPVLRFRTSPVELAHTEDYQRLTAVVPGIDGIISWLSVKSFTDFIDEVADPKFRTARPAPQTPRSARRGRGRGLR